MPVYGCDFGYLACLVGWTYLGIAASAFSPVSFVTCFLFFSFSPGRKGAGIQNEQYTLVLLLLLSWYY